MPRTTPDGLLDRASRPLVRRVSRLTAWLVVGGALTAAVGPATGATSPEPARATRSDPVDSAELPLADIPLHDCRILGIAHAVRCGALRRPLDPARPGGPAIGLRYLVVPALARDKRPDPIFFLAGGPGQSAIDVAPQLMPVFGRLNQRRDIVFVDQRGTGRSTPLDCADAPASEQVDAGSVEAQLAQLQRCRRALLERPALRPPGALGLFTTPIAAQDLEAVRQALGAPRVDLVGVSYGTRLALEFMRQRPGAVRRAVLDSVAPPDMALPASFSTDGQAALVALLAACEREPACRDAYPALRTDWHALLARLPQTVERVDPVSGRSSRRPLTRESVLGAVRGALYSPAVAAALPAAIDAAAHGRVDALAGLDALVAPRRGAKLALGLHFAVVCSEDLPRVGIALPGAPANPPGADLGTSTVELYRRACADWPRGALPPGFVTIPRTPVPTLLLAGGLDPATPPRHARRVAAALGPEAQLIEVPNAGHNLLAVGCAPDIVFRFIESEAPAVAGTEADCLRRLPRPLAFLPPQRPVDAGEAAR